MQRMALQDQIGVEHLLASSAIPFIFPAVPLYMGGHREYCGDGSMRQLAPISPAIHLGASKVLVVGAGRLTEPAAQRRCSAARYPSLAQIAGHAMSSIFLDSLAVDIERLNRINLTLSMLPRGAAASRRRSSRSSCW
jgi:NTE family protein